MPTVYVCALGILPANQGVDPAAVYKDRRVLDLSVGAWKAGISPGQPVTPLKGLYPELELHEYLEGRHLPLLDRARDILCQRSPVVEPDGINAFTRVSPEYLPGIAEELMKLGAFLVIAGAAEGKFLAKAAALQAYREARSRGHTGTVTRIIAPDRARGILRHLPVNLLWAVPPGLREELRRSGLRTLGEIASVPETELSLRFGEWGLLAAKLARSEEILPLRPLYPRRVVEAAVEIASSYREQLDHALAHLAAKLAKELGSSGCACRRLSLSVEDGEGSRLSAERLLQPPRSTSPGLLSALKTLATRIAGVPPVTISAGAHDLVPLAPEQPHLFERLDRRRKGQLDAALDTLARRYGKPVVRYGREQPPSWTEEMLAHWDPLRRKDRHAG